MHAASQAYRAASKVEKSQPSWSGKLLTMIKAERSFEVKVGSTVVIKWLWDDDMDVWSTKILQANGKLTYYSLAGTKVDVLAKVLDKARKWGVKGPITFNP